MAAPNQGAMKGGFMNAPQVQYSKQTQDLLKDMMRESKLTNFQQRHITRTLNGTGNLPQRVPPTTSKVDHRIFKAAKPLPKVLNPKNCSDRGVRSKDQIEASGAFERPDYVPVRGCTRSAREKEKLANIMAYGKDQPRIPMKNIRVRLESPEPLPDRFDELQSEVHERQDFLNDMEKIGKGGEYRGMIATEISGLVREMEIIDRKRSAELQNLIAQEESKKKSKDPKSIPNATV